MASCRDILCHKVRFVSSYSRICLLKVYVHSDRFHVVKRVLLIEGQAEVSLVVHRWALRVLLGFTCIVLARTNVNGRIAVFQSGDGHELTLVGSETASYLVNVFLFQLSHLVHLLDVLQLLGQ